MIPPTKGYNIGTPNKPWGATEKAEWLKTRKIHRSYPDEVLSKLDNIDGFTKHQYGTLEVKNCGIEGKENRAYPKFALKSDNWDDSKPCFLLTGGVHGYEKSGVQGAILFLQTSAKEYSKTFNILAVPSVSPWGYETIERWNHRAVDPNRSFSPDGELVEGRSFNPEPATEESAALIAYLKSLGVAKWMCHIDLHETTDSDQLEFRPAKRARDGLSPETLAEAKINDPIPDGFYLVSDSTNPQKAWHKAMIDSVRKVTHIAPAEADGTLIGETVSQEGVIIIPSPKSLGLCSGVTNASYATTTEVYPDSPSATEEECNRAQVACIEGGLQFIIKEHSLSIYNKQ